MSRLIGLVGEAGTGEVRIRRSGAGDLDRGLPGQRSAPERNQGSLSRSVVQTVCMWFVRPGQTLFWRQGGGLWQGAGGGSVEDPLSVLIVG